MKVIGLTGGIGSGKSTVSRFLAELGAVILDVDRVGHEAFKPDTEIYQQVVAAFGQQILTPGGDIDREKLGEIVFGNPESLARLNQIMHPPMHEMVSAQLDDYRRQGREVVVIEAPLLIEVGWTSSVDEVWVTTASEATVLSRLEAEKRLSHQQALARIHSQLSSAERLRHADVVIDTDCDLGELRARVGELWRGFQSRCSLL